MVLIVIWCKVTWDQGLLFIVILSNKLHLLGIDCVLQALILIQHVQYTVYRCNTKIFCERIFLLLMSDGFGHKPTLMCMSFWHPQQTVLSAVSSSHYNKWAQVKVGQRYATVETTGTDKTPCSNKNHKRYKLSKLCTNRRVREMSVMIFFSKDE